MPEADIESVAHSVMERNQRFRAESSRMLNRSLLLAAFGTEEDHDRFVGELWEWADSFGPSPESDQAAGEA